MLLVLFQILVVLFIAYSALGWTLYFMQAKFVYRPLRDVFYTPADLGLDFEKVALRTTDGLKIRGWYVPADNAELTLLFCHGNGGNIVHRLDSISIFNELGLNCFIFDYRGYGKSHGQPSEQGTYLDAESAFRWLVNEKHVSPDNIIIFGRSLGASVAAHLAGSVKARALILESGFTSYVDIGKKFYPYMPVRLFARFSYNTISYVKKVHCPVMIIHSRNDEIVPFEFGLQLYEAANEPKDFVEIFGNHNDGFLISGELYKKAWAKWLQFLRRYNSCASQQDAS